MISGLKTAQDTNRLNEFGILLVFQRRPDEVQVSPQYEEYLLLLQERNR